MLSFSLITSQYRIIRILATKLNNLKNEITFIFCLFFLCVNSNSQQKYPQNYFRKPIDIPVIIAGTFGELRTDHFHSGIDLKTQQKEGLSVYAAAEGYVSRIKISNWGYGKALYITHPNGYTTVYAHLKKFNKKIEAYIYKKQREQEKYEIQVFPEKSELIISKNEPVAFSGSTGGFIKPHLHFEIRDTKTEEIINPMHFGLLAEDAKKPKILTLQAYALNDSSHVKTSNIALPIKLKEIEEGKYITDQIESYGVIGFGIDTHDQQNGALNKNGVYKIEMSVNGKTIYEHQLEKFAFSESKYINLHIDYPNYALKKRKYQKTFIHPENKLGIYRSIKEKGYLQIKNNLDYQVIIKVSDFNKNTSTITIPVKGVKKTPFIKSKKPENTTYFIDYKKENVFEREYVKISFPKNTFYDNFFLDFKIKDSIITIHRPEIPLHKNYHLKFDVSKYSDIEKEKLFIAYMYKKKHLRYCKTIKTDSIFKTAVRTLGDFSLISDNEAPVISECSFYSGQNLKNYRYFTIKLEDKLSGIKNYRAEIDGKWALLELDVKTNTLTYDFNRKKLDKGKHIFTLLAMDNVGNTCTFTSNFYIK